MALQGGDPEIHVVNRKTGEAVSSHELPKETFFEYDSETNDDLGYRVVSDIQDFPRRTISKRDGSALELEFGPSTCRDYYIPGMQHHFFEMREKLEKEFPVKDWKLSASATVTLSDSTLKTAPEDVLMFGCQPEENIYKGTLAPTCPTGLKQRFNGGHMHLDYPVDKDYYLNRYASKVVDVQDVVRGLDVGVAVPLVAILGYRERDVEVARRQYYGMAGSYRPKEYGLEYRTLSAKALIGHPVLFAAVMGTSREKAHRYADEKYSKGFDVEAIINEHDVEQARAMLNERLLTDNTDSGYAGWANTSLGVFVSTLNDSAVRFPDDLDFTWQSHERGENHKWGGLYSVLALANIDQRYINLRSSPAIAQYKANYGSPNQIILPFKNGMTAAAMREV